MLPRAVFFLGVGSMGFLWTACGDVAESSTTSPGTDAATASSDSAGSTTPSDDSASPANDDARAATTDASSHPIRATCKEIRAELDGLGAKMRSCCPTCDSIQCNHHQPDLCCPFSTSLPPDSDESQRHTKLVTAYIDAQCEVACTNALCKERPSSKCQPNATGDGGSCVP